ncbi:forkhead-associated domain-containing protein, putative [Eimeria tenella]|uniref:Forkhead-associated domain-containing protein, putative n=1 Tax=Eimeria tenella TaxID=5802 RepID=U6KHI1_EIMTE|nr:forkhead-associated domain-containing protein, putative [Eimeria tenella]CDJ37374.1 forkhead-associated domain-containing protein, putative [Eimeria tenella]|eukprot:XP_013228212.1 forkhead-associated domain-containing protein, putative [Eimeria tenella]
MGGESYRSSSHSSSSSSSSRQDTMPPGSWQRTKQESCYPSYSSSSSSSSRSHRGGWDVKPEQQDTAATAATAARTRWRSRSPQRGAPAAAAAAAAAANGGSYKRVKEEEAFDSATAAAAAAARAELAAAAAAASKQEAAKRAKEEPRSRRRRREEDAAAAAANYEWGGKEIEKKERDKSQERFKPALKPTFEPSGLLAEDAGEAAATQMERNGVPLKHGPPADESLPDKKWRLYQFKKQHRKSLASPDEEPGKVLHIHRRSWFLFGKDNRVADVLLLHPTVSKQHAVLQYRRRFGNVVPYIIDLESTNGTYLNDERVEAARYIELREGDTLRFGKSTREFVLLHSGSVDVKMSYEEFLQQRDKEKQQQQQQQQQVGSSTSTAPV